MNKRAKHIAGNLVLLLVLFSQGCGVYSLGGIKVPPEMKTVSVQFFENNAPLVVPDLARKLTEALKDRIRSQSSLSIVTANGHGNFESRITDYSIAPKAIQGNDRAGLLRLTITVNVKYTNVFKKEDEFEQSFSRYFDFPPPVQAQETNAISKVNVMLTEDIFNRAFANW
ncbi:LptE family protein [Hufsiella ginkgonis]|uniref:LptE family protein n=1 Tax=Hufsiella ginkgonis TaxID=2695274 RepID=A0A7K1Y366_9SPHI|nr:LptE family protein [Hufsiella ginkgonis]MXV17548.1 hypothetical protein [Hufsiella ginkgonis]